MFINQNLKSCLLYVFFSFLVFSLLYQSYYIREINHTIIELKKDLDVVEKNQQQVDYNKITEIVKHELNENSISNKTVNQIKSILNSAERTYQLYSKDYVEQLIKNIDRDKNILRPDGSLSQLAKTQFDAFLNEYNLETYDDGVNKGVVKDVVNDNAKQKRELVQRIKGLMPNSTEQEIETIILKQ